MTNQTIAAIQEEAEYLDRVFGTIRHNLAGRVFHGTPTASIGDLINDGERKTLQIKILCANAEKDSITRSVSSDAFDSKECEKCHAWFGTSGPGNFCPGCGRRIEGGGEG